MFINPNIPDLIEQVKSLIEHFQLKETAKKIINKSKEMRFDYKEKIEFRQGGIIYRIG